MLPLLLAQEANSGAGAIAGLLVLLVGLFFYFLPFVVALMRGHKNATAIFVLNLLLGWTLIGWVIALVWAFTKS
jgi:hypothetical protein